MDDTTYTDAASQGSSATPVNPGRRGAKKGEMNFIKTFLASTLGFFAGLFGLGLLVFVGLIIIIASIDSDPATTKPPVASNSLLVMKLHGSVPEFVSTPSFSSFLDDFSVEITYDYLRALEAAADDEKIAGLWLQLEGYQGTAAQITALTRGIKKFKESGKFVYATSKSDGYGEGEYILAACADSIFLPHSGIIELNGSYAALEFYKPLMDKLNVKPIMIRAGSYKSAVEPFTRESASPENRAMVQELIDEQFAQMKALVAEGRGLSVEEVDNIVENYPLIMPEDALQLKLADRLVYDDEIEAIFKAKLNDGDTTKRLREITVGKYIGWQRTRGGQEVDSDNAIAVVYAVGAITTGESDNNPSPFFGGDQLGSKTFVKAMRQAREDDDIKAVVLRISSPGGGLSPSIEMWREVKLTAEKKPVVVSMANVAASGGYYIATPAHEIIAEETTITGSIGIYALGFNIDGFYEKTIGINTEVLRTGPYADMLSGVRDLSAEEQAFAERQITDRYNQFLQVVADGRGMSTEDVNKVAQGRVWTGKQAMELGLVDKLGGMELALERAADRAGISNYDTYVYPRQKEKIEMLLDLLDLETATSVMEQAQDPTTNFYQQVKDALAGYSGMQARMVGIRVE